MEDKNKPLNSLKDNKQHHLSRYSVLAIYFGCVTFAAIIFDNANILGWYLLGPIMEIVHKLPVNSGVQEYNEGINLDYRRYHIKDSDSYRR